jgi:flagella basal body P-ring formation protein FlgA
VLPVTCLDGGGMGQSIRVRVRNSDRMLRAQVAGAGRVRVGL